MWKLFFRKSVVKQLEKIQKSYQIRIKEKLNFYCKQKNPIEYAIQLTDPKIGTYRFRILDYKIIFVIGEEGRIIIITLIGHRKEIYKDI